MARGNIKVSIEWDVAAENLRVELCAQSTPQKVRLMAPFGQPQSSVVDLEVGRVAILQFGPALRV